MKQNTDSEWDVFLDGKYYSVKHIPCNEYALRKSLSRWRWSEHYYCRYCGKRGPKKIKKLRDFLTDLTCFANPRKLPWRGDLRNE